MQCPPEIAVIVCEILRTGLLRIRACKDADRCALEADHLHNLPALLADYKPERLEYYWNIERRCLKDRYGHDEQFEPLWKMLAKHVPTATARALAG